MLVTRVQFYSMRPTPDTVQQAIAADGPFEPQENERLHQKWFAPGPRRRTLAAIRTYGLDKKRTVDIGSSYGNNSIYLGEGSYGVEIEPRCVVFANAIGLESYEHDVVTTTLEQFDPAEAALAWAVMEHVESQHKFLRNIASGLEDNGMLILYVPTIPLLRLLWLPKEIRKYFNGHQHGDHVNAYTKRTVKFICERAGFCTVACNPGFYGALRFLNYIPGVAALCDGVLYVGYKIPNWEYPGGSTRQV